MEVGAEVSAPAWRVGTFPLDGLLCGYLCPSLLSSDPAPNPTGCLFPRDMGVPGQCPVVPAPHIPVPGKPKLEVKVTRSRAGAVHCLHMAPCGQAAGSLGKQQPQLLLSLGLDHQEIGLLGN